MPHDDQTISVLLDRLNAGDCAPRQALIDRTCKRLEAMAHRQLQGFPRVHRWEETADVVQNASIRLFRALEHVQPHSAREFFGLASTMIRRELLDLKRHYCNAEGMGAHHASMVAKDDSSVEPMIDRAGTMTYDPAGLAEWTEIHQQVEQLPPELREVVDLLWYQELSQEEAAAALGVDPRTIRRRWREARMRLGQALRL